MLGKILKQDTEFNESYIIKNNKIYDKQGYYYYSIIDNEYVRENIHPLAYNEEIEKMIKWSITQYNYQDTIVKDREKIKKHLLKQLELQNVDKFYILNFEITKKEVETWDVKNTTLWGVEHANINPQDVPLKINWLRQCLNATLVKKYNNSWSMEYIKFDHND